MSANIPKWKASGDWFDVCKCNIPCPCTFAQAPSDGECQGVLAYHIRNGHYGETSLDCLNALALSYFKGNIWAGNTKASIAFFIDERANQQQRHALQMIFTGKAGGFMATFATLIGDDRGVNFAPIKFEVADDLSYWSVEIQEKVVAKAEAVTGAVATWGRAVADEVNAPEVRYKWKRKGNSSKHIPFDWSGP